jgi:hypothetical protein
LRNVDAQFPAPAQESLSLSGEAFVLATERSVWISRKEKVRIARDEIRGLSTHIDPRPVEMGRDGHFFQQHIPLATSDAQQVTAPTSLSNSFMGRPCIAPIHTAIQRL